MIIYNAEIYSMTEDMHFYGYVEVHDGKITAVEQGKPDATTEEDIDCQGGRLFPGFIDAHTHLGIIEDGIDFEETTAMRSLTPLRRSSVRLTASILLTAVSLRQGRRASPL